MQGFTPQFTLQKLLTSLQPRNKICRLEISFSLVKRILWSCFATLVCMRRSSSTSEIDNLRSYKGESCFVFSLLLHKQCFLDPDSYGSHNHFPLTFNRLIKKKESKKYFKTVLVHLSLEYDLFVFYLAACKSLKEHVDFLTLRVN